MWYCQGLRPQVLVDGENLFCFQGFCSILCRDGPSNEECALEFRRRGLTDRFPRQCRARKTARISGLGSVAGGRRSGQCKKGAADPVSERKTFCDRLPSRPDARVAICEGAYPSPAESAYWGGGDYAYLFWARAHTTGGCHNHLTPTANTTAVSGCPRSAHRQPRAQSRVCVPPDRPPSPLGKAVRRRLEERTLQRPSCHVVSALVFFSFRNASVAAASSVNVSGSMTTP